MKRTPSPLAPRALVFGFTLVEILVVLAIIGLVAGVIVLNTGSDERRTAEREAKRLAINSDRSAYTQQGLRPAGGEPWRGHAGGVDESFFWGGSTGRRAW